MTDYAATGAVVHVELDANAVLKRAWQLYKRLFARSLLMAGLVFGAVNLVQVLLRSSAAGSSLGLLVLVLSIAATSLLEGGLVEIVRGLHVDGNDEASVREALGRSSGRLMKLVRVSLLSALAMGLGFLLFVVPGFVLMTRWAIAVPVAMLEEGNARDALRRSHEMIDGNGWNVFQVIFAAGLLTGVVAIPLALVAANAGAFGWWVAVTLSSTLTAPYTAHALTVVYYTLADPQRPVVLDPGHRWQSVWDEQAGRDASHEEHDATPDPQSEIISEYERRFDEHERLWGNRG